MYGRRLKDSCRDAALIIGVIGMILGTFSGGGDRIEIMTFGKLTRFLCMLPQMRILVCVRALLWADLLARVK